MSTNALSIAAAILPLSVLGQLRNDETAIGTSFSRGL